jgi:anti-sigma regulatory factor (Ser/Thr protein kinase)
VDVNSSNNACALSDAEDSAPLADGEHFLPHADGEHSVLFYTRDEELAAGVAEYLARALLAAGAAVVIATPSHQRMIETALNRAGVDVSMEMASGRLICLDAAETLASFSPAGKIDPQAIRQRIGNVVRAAGGRGQPLHAFGEMVSLLWEDGDVLAAIELEELWNSLQEETRFSLMCAYRQAAVSAPGQRGALQRVCQLHSMVHNTPPRSVETVELEAQFSPEAEAPSSARRLLADAMERTGNACPQLREDAQLLISELVTNAVLHAQSHVSVVVRCEASSVCLWVRDFSPDPPVKRNRSQAIECNRSNGPGLGLGLQLIDSLASDWGVEPHADGKAVWAQLRA